EHGPQGPARPDGPAAGRHDPRDRRRADERPRHHRRHRLRSVPGATCHLGIHPCHPPRTRDHCEGGPTALASADLGESWPNSRRGPATRVSERRPMTGVDDMRRSRRHASMWIVAAFLTTGCQEEGLPHFGTLQYESESFEVWASEGLAACGGTFEYTEQWLVAFRDRIGERSNREKHIFYWLSPEDQDRSSCRSGTAGCALLQ